MRLNTTQTGLSQKRIWSKTDKVAWGTTLVICALLAEGILAAGACALTQSLLDQISTNWSRNTYVAVGMMLTVAAVLVIADLVIVGLWLGRWFLRCERRRRCTLTASDSRDSTGPAAIVRVG
jgi:hypothetical protein